MNEPHNRDAWHQYEGLSEGPCAEYSDFDEQASLEREAERAHSEFVERVAAEFGFTLSKWTPIIPVRR